MILILRIIYFDLNPDLDQGLDPDPDTDTDHDPDLDPDPDRIYLRFFALNISH